MNIQKWCDPHLHHFYYHHYFLCFLLQRHSFCLMFRSFSRCAHVIPFYRWSKINKVLQSVIKSTSFCFSQSLCLRIIAAQWSNFSQRPSRRGQLSWYRTDKKWKPLNILAPNSMRCWPLHGVKASSFLKAWAWVETSSVCGGWITISLSGILTKWCDSNI